MLTKNEQILLLILFFIAIYIKWKINNLDKKNIEKFTLTDTETQEAIKTSIKRIYLTDVEAIRLLSNFAIQLNQNGVTIPGNVKFLGTVTTNSITTKNVNANGNINVTGNIDISGNITAINSINISGNNNIIDTDNITANNVTANNITAKDNIVVKGNSLKFNNNYAINVSNDTTNIMQITPLNNESINSLNGFKFYGTTGTLECNEIICNKISGPSAIGAWLMIYDVRCFPIFYSISDYTDYYLNDTDNGYFIMPGYKVVRYKNANHEGDVITMNNYNGTKPLVYNIKTNNVGSSCKLFYWIGPGTTDNDFKEIIRVQ